MSHKFLFDSIFHAFLKAIDKEIALDMQNHGCPDCGGTLHQAHYPRSPMGLPIKHRIHYEQRLSFCCYDCRKRVTPASVRFFGRRWFPAPLFLLLCVLNTGVTERRLKQVRRHFGIMVSESTWKRWQRWWREHFVNTKFFQQAKGYLLPNKGVEGFPRCLLRLFKGALQNKLILLLQFLSPMTAGFLRAV